MRQKSKILIIDDNPTIRDMVSWMLELEGYEPFEAAEGMEGFQILREQYIDLILLDLVMPGMSGSEFLRRLRATGDTTPIIIISTHPEEQAWCIENGADIMVVKPFNVRNLLAVVKAVLRKLKDGEHSQFTFTHVMPYGDLEVDIQTHVARYRGRILELTPREFKLLAFFLQHPQQVLSRDLILDHVWGFDFEGESNIVDVYVGYLRNELEKEGEPRLIQTVRGVGYALRESSTGK